MELSGGSINATELVAALLDKGQADMTDLYSEKTGKLYNARVLLETDQKGRARFKSYIVLSNIRMKRTPENGRSNMARLSGGTVI